MEVGRLTKEAGMPNGVFQIYHHVQKRNGVAKGTRNELDSPPRTKRPSIEFSQEFVEEGPCAVEEPEEVIDIATKKWDVGKPAGVEGEELAQHK